MIRTHVEDIYYFEVNIKYISFIELKISELSRVRRTSENSNVFNARDGIYLVFTEKKNLFILYFYSLHAMSHPLKKGVLKMQKRKLLATPNNFGTKIFVIILLRNCISTLDVFVLKYESYGRLEF